MDTSIYVHGLVKSQKMSPPCLEGDGRYLWTDDFRRHVKCPLVGSQHVPVIIWIWLKVTSQFSQLWVQTGTPRLAKKRPDEYPRISQPGTEKVRLCHAQGFQLVQSLSVLDEHGWTTFCLFYVFIKGPTKMETQKPAYCITLYNYPIILCWCASQLVTGL